MMSTPDSPLIDSVFNPQPVTRTTLAELLKEVEDIKAGEKDEKKHTVPSLLALKHQAREAIYAYLKARSKGNEVQATYTNHGVILSTKAIGSWDGVPGCYQVLTKRSHAQFLRHFDTFLRTQEWYNQYCESHTFGGVDGVVTMGVAFRRNNEYKK